MTSFHSVCEKLDTLIGFDTTSRNSNLDIIDWIEGQLTPLGAHCVRILDESGTKSNLWVRIGPDVAGGLILSGHTDVVPVDGQDWHTDPFQLTEQDGRLYGRGTSDMKSFVALCLAFAPDLARLDLQRPVHFAFSYDEEVGCKGAPAMIERIIDAGARPEWVWVGEPTLWNVVSGHKGRLLMEVEVTGHEAHSSLSHRGISAIGEAVDLMAILRNIEKDLAAQPEADSAYDPPYPTLTIGEVQGGTAANILARKCLFRFDLRCPPGFDPHQIIAPFTAAVEAGHSRLQDRFAEAGIRVTQLSDVPPLSVQTKTTPEGLVRALTGDNALRAVAYTTEAGQFQMAGIPAVVCGPGSIEQAHKPNEFIDRGQLQQGVEIFCRLVQRLEATQ